jgi:hypothetical protein
MHYLYLLVVWYSQTLVIFYSLLIFKFFRIHSSAVSNKLFLHLINLILNFHYFFGTGRSICIISRCGSSPSSCHLMAYFPFSFQIFQLFLYPTVLMTLLIIQNWTDLKHEIPIVSKPIKNKFRLR